MKYPNNKMQLKVTIPALTSVIISTAAAVLLVCATNLTEPKGKLEQISSEQPRTTTNSFKNRTALGQLIHKTTEHRQVRSFIRIQNGTIQSNRSGEIEAQASILRPLIMKHLLSGGKRRPVASAPPPESVEEEEEEVTKTIVVPVNPNDAEFKQSDGKQSEAAESSMEPNDTVIQHISGQQMKLRGSQSKTAAGQKAGNQHSMFFDMSAVQPSAEASLRLTSTQISGLLNDREAPEFYRERELNADGVVVGEERPSSPSHSSFSSASSRLGMAASGHSGDQFIGGGGFGDSTPYGNNLGFDSSDASLYRHRLSQAASEDAYGGGGGGFNHRFGQQSFGAGGEGELGYGHGAGGLMQAPNEYNEVNSMGATGGYMGEGQSHSFGGGGGGGDDYSLQSGLLRAGSEGIYGGGGGGGGMGHGMGNSAGGFMGHGSSLETAAARGYGPGGIGPSADLMGHSNAFGGGGRLQAHASYNPYMQSAGEGDYASRFEQNQGAAGFSSMGGFGDHRGFASQNNHQLLRSASSSGSPHSSGFNARGLSPLNPTVPLPEDLPSPVTQQSILSSNQRKQISQQTADLANLIRQQENLQDQQRFAPRTRHSNQHIHEALEEDPTDTSSDEELSGHQQQAQQNYETITSTEESPARARPAEQQMVRFSGGQGPSLVLNVPPPVDQSAAAPVAQMVEFSRVGSAGYLGPRSSSLAKKSGPPSVQLDSESSGGDEEGGASGDSSSDGEPIENPAHAGKYIID